MKSVSEFSNSAVRFLFTDIDDTITDDGQLRAPAYSALWNLQDVGISVIPVTGRPAGWCEMIARFWPVAGVVGENGGLYFRYHKKTMKREFFTDAQTQIANRKKLDLIAAEVLAKVPGSAIASDQFARLLDLAIDFAEDVPPLNEKAVDQIVSIFHQHGAEAKVSSIHVNGWFGKYDKLSMCKHFMLKEFSIDLNKEPDIFAFSGDSPNDEPMFGFFKNSFAVANIKDFLNRIQHRPAFVAGGRGGTGFVEIAEKLIALKKG